MSDDLKPCPFCGAESFLLYSDGHAIQCGRCDAGGPQLHETEKDQTAEHAWNTRHVPELTEAERFAMAKGLRDFLASAPLDEQVRYPGSILEYYECAIRAAIAAMRGTT